MRISDWSSDVCSSDLSTGRTGKPSEWETRHAMHKRILIVDDEPAIREMVAFALRKGEYEPAHAGDAREAQESIANRVPDLILLAWMLPGTSGTDLRPEERRVGNVWGRKGWSGWGPAYKKK